MKLPIPFFKKKKEEGKFYLALLLIDKKVESAVLEEENGKIKIVGTHKEMLASSIETAPQEELISSIDNAISRAEESLPPNIETHKTVFGVKENWIEKNSKKIKKEYLNKLKKLCDKLDLTPIGFMVINEAIANMLSSEEGAPLSAIFVDLEKNKAELLLYRGGQIAERVEGQINDSIPSTVDNLLKKFTAPVLPSKLIIAHASNKEGLAKELVNYPWSKSLPFLHVPQISVLSEKYYIKSIIYSTAVQLGFDVLGLHTLESSQEVKSEVNRYENADEEAGLSSISKSDEQSAGFGFMINEDIAENPPVIHGEKEAHQPNHFSKNDSGDNIESEEKPDINATDQDTDAAYAFNDKFEDDKNEKKQNILEKLKAFIPIQPLQKLSGIKSFLGNNKKTKLIGIATIGAFLIIILLGVIYYYNSNAEIILSVKPNEVAKEENITFSTSAGSDFSENIIAATTITTKLDGEASSETSGEKEIGERATGTVTIFNKDNAPVTLNNGTEIESSKGLKFKLTESVKVASASGDIFSGTTPGKTDVEIQANDIGTESNLPSGTTFTVGGNNDLAAKNDDVLSGGSSETIRVVAEKDVSTLKKKLLGNLDKKAIDSLGKTAGSGKTVIPVILDTEFENEKLDNNIGSEANSVKLTATVVFTGISYDKNQLNDFAKSILKDEYSENISFADDSLTVKLQNHEQENNDEVSAVLKITAGLLPEIDKKEIIKKVKGKSPKTARAMLNALPQVEKTEIKYSPNIFFLSKLIPKLPDNLEAKIIANEK